MATVTIATSRASCVTDGRQMVSNPGRLASSWVCVCASVCASQGKRFFFQSFYDVSCSHATADAAGRVEIPQLGTGPSVETHLLVVTIGNSSCVRG